MNQFTRIGLLTGAFALSPFAGCSKDDKVAAPKGEEVLSGADVAKSAETPPAETATVADVAGLTKETLLVLKFHHDS